MNISPAQIAFYHVVVGFKDANKLQDIEAIDSATFAIDAVRRLKDAKHFGAVGVKFRKDLGCYLKDKTGKFVAVNDPRMNAVWDTAGEIGLLILIHVADPIGFFTPWNEFNPTYPKLLKSTHDALMAQFEDILTRFPDTTFVGLHYASLVHDLERLVAMLDKYPNLYVEMGARHWTLGIKTFTASMSSTTAYRFGIARGIDMVADIDDWKLPARDRCDWNSIVVFGIPILQTQILSLDRKFFRPSLQFRRALLRNGLGVGKEAYD